MSDNHTNKLKERKMGKKESMPNRESNKLLDRYMKDKFRAIVICIEGRLTSLVVQNPFS